MVQSSAITLYRRPAGRTRHLAFDVRRRLAPFDPMASVYALKSRFQALLRPLVLRLAAAGATANQITVLAAALSVATGAMLAWRGGPWFLLLPVVLFVRMALNATDGMLAREHGQKSHLGALLNELCDVLSDAALYLPFSYAWPAAGGWVAVVVVGAVITELAGVLGQTIGSTRRYDGPMGKSDRAVLFGALGLYFGAGGSLSPSAIRAVLAISILFLAITIVRRCRNALKEVA